MRGFEIKGRSRARLAVFLGMLASLAPLATDMYLPSLPVMPDEFGTSTSVVQLTLTMTMAGMAIGQIFAGPISDMSGRRAPLIVGMTVFALSSLVCARAESIAVFLIFRFVEGLSGAFGIVTARAIARDVCDGPELTRFFSMLMLVNGLAPVLSPVIGAQILLFSSWRGVFVLLTLIGAGLAIASFRFEESLPERMRINGLGESFSSFSVLFNDKYFLGHCLMQCFTFAAFFAYIAGSPFIFQNIYRVSAQEYSAIFGGIGAAIALTGFLGGRLAGRIKDMSLLLWGLTESLAGSLAFLVCVLTSAPLSLTVISLLCVIPMISIIGAASFSLAMKEHKKTAGSASAMIGFFSMISGGIMAPVVGAAGSDTALPTALVMVIGEAGALLIFFKMIRRR